MEKETRSREQIRHHYEVEKELAQRLLHSTREQRTALLHNLYDELFARVPDHPRVKRRDTPDQVRQAVGGGMNLLRGWLGADKTLVEFGAGDCTLAFEASRHLKKVCAVDISDQTGGGRQIPANFELVLYDGYHLNLPDNSVDIAFSYQFIEHLHPDDVEPHFQIIRRILKPGGVYIFSTPHRYSGPHDISAYFSDTPEGFHFKEWTYREMHALIRRVGFRAGYTYRFGKARCNVFANAATFAVEMVMGWLPRKLQKTASRRVFQGVNMVLIK